MTGSLYLGTSGFSFDGWKHGVFYPEGLKNREMLSYYSSQLSSVEINYTFRRFPTEKSLTAWREEAQPGFVFTLKANQRITHFKRLKDADEDVRDFLERAKTLGDRLGCVLFQCPPSLKYDQALIESFARKNGLVSAAVFIPGVDFPILTLNQLRLVLRICAAHGLEIDNQRAPEIAATVAAGLGARAIARELLDFVPVAGWLVKGALAYTATKALGQATIKYCETRTPSQSARSAT